MDTKKQHRQQPVRALGTGTAHSGNTYSTSSIAVGAFVIAAAACLQGSPDLWAHGGWIGCLIAGSLAAAAYKNR